MKIELLPAAFAAVVFCAAPVMAQAPAPAAQVHVRGTIESLNGNVLKVHGTDGKEATVNLAPNFKVTGAVKMSLSDIKPTDYIGTAVVKQADGKLHALEVSIFPAASKGVGEGTRAWDLVPDNTMINAYVGQVSGAGGNTLQLTYKGGGTADVVVGPDTPVFTTKPADVSLLTPGTFVVVMATKGADGSFNAAGVSAEMNGVKPAN